MNQPAQGFNAAALPLPSDKDIAAFQELAAHRSKEAIMAALVQHGAAAIVNARDKDGRTAIISAAMTGHMDVIGLLLQAGANIDAHDGDGKTAMMHAARQGYPATVSLLLDNGANLNAADARGRNALMVIGAERANTRNMYPLSKKKQETAKLLIARGIDLGAKDRAGRTAEDNAREHGHLCVVDLIKEEYARKDALWEEHQKAVESFTKGLQDDMQVRRVRYKHQHGRRRR